MITEKELTAKIHSTSKELAKMMLTKVYDNKQWIIRTPSEDIKLTKEEVAHINEQFSQFTVEVLQLIASIDIESGYASSCCDLVISCFENIKKTIDGRILDSKRELVDRYIGVRSPLDNTYLSDFATYKDILVKLQEARNSTGNDPEDYIRTRTKALKAEELSTDEENVASDEAK